MTKELWNSAQPLPKSAYEKYARSRANGAGPSQAYKLHVAGDDTKSTSIKSAAHHLDLGGCVLGNASPAHDLIFDTLIESAVNLRD